jgi:hypothetical protein
MRTTRAAVVALIVAVAAGLLAAPAPALEVGSKAPSSRW